MNNKTKKLLILNLPYFIAGLVCTNLGEAWRIAEGADMSEKLLGFLSALGAAFSNPMPSLHPMDLLIGVCCGAGLRLAVYLKGKNAKKYRHGMEYGSARWGTQKDIEPFEDPVFANNVDPYKDRAADDGRSPEESRQMPETKMCLWSVVPAAVRPDFGSNPTFYNVTVPMWSLTRKAIS